MIWGFLVSRDNMVMILKRKRKRNGQIINVYSSLYDSEWDYFRDYIP